MADFQPVVFKLGSERYGVDISLVSAIEKGQDVVRVPNSSTNIKGIINLRGEIIPVVDLKTKFNMKDTVAGTETELVIVNLANMKIALEVDGVDEIHNFTADNLVDMPVIAKTGDSQYFFKVAKAGDKLIILIDPVKLLSEDEAQAAKQLTNDSAKED